jgi:uncharacterized protein YuzE
VKVRYFEDTDTALLEFLDRPVAETRELSEDIYIDVDANSAIVSMTIEHARENAQLPEVAFEAVAVSTP